MRWGHVWITMAVVTLLESPRCFAVDSSPQGSEASMAVWAPLLTAYARNPRAHRRRLLANAGEGGLDLPVPVLLAVADAHLRSGEWQRASYAAKAVVDRNPGEPWVSWGRLAYAWAAMSAGDDREARRQFAFVAMMSRESGPLASVVVSLIDAMHDKVDDAVATLLRLASDHSVRADVRTAANLGLGLSYLWREDFVEADRAFRAVMAMDPQGALWDEAAYGAARAHLGAGDLEGSRQMLQVIVRSRKSPTRGLRENELALNPSAILRTSMRRYRRAPAGSPEAQLLMALDWGGSAMARVALRRQSARARLTRDGNVPQTSTPAGRSVMIDEPSRRGVGHADGYAGGSSPAVALPSPSGIKIFAWCLLLVGVGLVIWALRPKGVR